MSTRATCLSLLLLACGCYPAEDFQEDSALTRCALYEECDLLSALGVDSYDLCLELLRSDAYACETYDPAAAAECISGLEELGCEDYRTGYFPMACVDACTLPED